MNPKCSDDPPSRPRSIQLPILNEAAPAANSIKKSRTSKWRAGVLILLNLLMIAHVVQWLLQGKTISPIEPSEAMYTLRDGGINAGFIFFSLAIVATLIFGRFVCGWGCHLLALQDLCGWLLKRAGLKPRQFRSRLLVFVPLIVALYMFVYPTVARWASQPPGQGLFPNFTNHLVVTDFWATFPPIAVAIPFLIICGMVTVYFLGEKAFCTYACPYGGFFAPADRLAPGRIRVTDACEGCGHCTTVCTSNVLVHAEVREYGMVVDRGCMKCMDCVSVCPNDALYFGFGKPSIGKGGKISRTYSLTWPEEIAAAIVFAVSFFAVWDVYQLVPMLLALGVAPVTTYLVMRTWKMVRAGDLSFYKWKLKSGGKFTRAGLVFAVVALIWTGLNAHSGFVRYHESGGASSFEKIKLPDELALARPNPARWIGQSDRLAMNEGARHFQTAWKFGLLTNADMLSKWAWIEYLSGNTDRAVEVLERATQSQRGQGRALSFYYRGAILNRLNRPDEALKDLDAALAEAPDLITAREERGESLWRLGRRDEAERVWRDAVAQGDRLVLAKHFLAAAAESGGRADEAVGLQREADARTPRDPLFIWVMGMRLENLGFNAPAARQFNEAIRLNPEFKKAAMPASNR